MKISAIVCGHNQGAYTRQSLESVLTQSLPPHEIIFIDNASQDDTASVVRSFGDKVDYIRSENHGPSSARNQGLKRASGEFVHFLDADDWLKPGFFAACREAIDLTPNADVIVGGQLSQTPSGNHTSPKPAPTGLENANRYLFSNSPWGIHAALVRRSAALAVGGFSEEMWQCEDWDFWLRLARNHGRFITIPGEYAVYRQVSGSNSSSYIKVINAAKKTLAQNLRRNEHPSQYRAEARRCLHTFRKALWHSRAAPTLRAHLQSHRLLEALRFAFSVFRVDPPTWLYSARMLLNSKRLIMAAGKGSPKSAP